jgi:hypothetical protein
MELVTALPGILAHGEGVRLAKRELPMVMESFLTRLKLLACLTK